VTPAAEDKRKFLRAGLQPEHARAGVFRRHERSAADAARLLPGGGLVFQRNRHFSHAPSLSRLMQLLVRAPPAAVPVNPSVVGRGSDVAVASLRGAMTAQHPGRKHDDAANDSEHAIDRDAHDAEWNQEDPDDRVHDNRQEREWPAQYEDDAPDEKCSHNCRYDHRDNSFESPVYISPGIR